MKVALNIIASPSIINHSCERKTSWNSDINNIDLPYWVISFSLSLTGWLFSYWNPILIEPVLLIGNVFLTCNELFCTFLSEEYEKCKLISSEKKCCSRFIENVCDSSETKCISGVWVLGLCDGYQLWNSNSYPSGTI